MALRGRARWKVIYFPKLPDTFEGRSEQLMTWSYGEMSRTEHERKDGGAMNGRNGRLSPAPDEHSDASRAYKTKENRALDPSSCSKQLVGERGPGAGTAMRGGAGHREPDWTVIDMSQSTRTPWGVDRGTRSSAAKITLAALSAAPVTSTHTTL